MTTTHDCERLVDWNGDGSYTPTCPTCGWAGKRRPVHSEALSAVRAHLNSKRHREAEARAGGRVPGEGGRITVGDMLGHPRQGY